MKHLIVVENVLNVPEGEPNTAYALVDDEAGTVALRRFEPVPPPPEPVPFPWLGAVIAFALFMIGLGCGLFIRMHR